MDEAGDLALAVGLGHRFFEPPQKEHLAVQLQERVSFG
jgi:hypothetical protein